MTSARVSQADSPHKCYPVLHKAGRDNMHLCPCIHLREEGGGEEGRKGGRKGKRKGGREGGRGKGREGRVGGRKRGREGRE